MCYQLNLFKIVVVFQKEKMLLGHPFSKVESFGKYCCHHCGPFGSPANSQEHVHSKRTLPQAISPNAGTKSVEWIGCI